MGFEDSFTRIGLLVLRALPWIVFEDLFFVLFISIEDLKMCHGGFLTGFKANLIIILQHWGCTVEQNLTLSLFMLIHTT